MLFIAGALRGWPGLHMGQNRDEASRQRFGLLLFGGFAVAFAVMSVVVGSHLDHLDVGFAAQGVETVQERVAAGDARFEPYRWLWRGAMGLASLLCAGFAQHFWRALRRSG